jgi:hypothetical protein
MAHAGMSFCLAKGKHSLAYASPSIILYLWNLQKAIHFIDYRGKIEVKEKL